MPRRRGFTLIELMIALILSAILGVIVLKVLLTTSRFYGRDAARRNARTTASGALGLMRSELRMLETSSALVSADSQSITVRVPYAMGILCTSGGWVAVVSLLPVDSLTYAASGLSGYAWRNSAGAWTVEERHVAVGRVPETVCTNAQITTLPGGIALAMFPAPSSGTVGSAVFLFQTVTYRFAESRVLPGRQALWRDVPARALSEELVAPFDSTARFRFYVLNGDRAQNRPPGSLTDVRGVELVLNGASERPPQGGTAPATAELTTAVFFHNRSN